MKKRFLCLLLTVVMLLACLAGCAEKTDEEAVDDVNEEASQNAMTLAMYLLSENEISDEQKELIQTEVNKITKSKFKTQLKLYFYTEDEYYTKLEEAFAARAAAEAAGTIAKPVEDETNTEEETFENEWGFSEIKYPDIADYQVDIFYVGGYTNFVKYLEMEKMQVLDTELTSASKKLNEYIAPSYLKYMKSVNNGTYAIPTNTAIGEYTYLLLNKEALKDYHYDTDEGITKFTSVTDPDVAELLNFVNTYNGASAPEGTTKYVPFYSNLTNTELVTAGRADVEKEDGNVSSSLHYFGVDAEGYMNGSFSLYGGTTSASAAFGNKNSHIADLGNVWNNPVFKSNLDTVMGYRKAGYFGTAEDLKKGDVAVACVKGGAELPAKYADKYEAVVIAKPTLSTMDLYENMYAVSSYTANTSRSMEIITYLNTNEELRNLLVYGVENENYELVDSDYLDEDGNAYKVVKRLNEEYMMDPEKVGNTLIGYCTEDEDPTLRAAIIKQNNDAVVDIMMGYTYVYNNMTIEAEALSALRELSADVEAKINACMPADAADTAYDTLKTEVAALLAEDASITLFEKLSNAVEPSDDTKPVGLMYSYTQWAIEKKIYVPAEEEA